MRILITDDSSFMRTMLKNILDNAGHDVVGEASNGKDALEKYKELRPDLVMMDITMPEVNGIEGVKLIKNFDSGAKIIMCSAIGQKLMVIDAISAGALDFIVKPFTRDNVLRLRCDYEKEDSFFLV